MSHELIPGMAHRIREALKRRVSGDAILVEKINRLTVEQIYGQAPSEAVEAVARAKPDDPADYRQWERYRDAADSHLDTKAINEWIRNIQHEHGVAPRRRRAA